jgi:sugar phosphate isomerase/epimerase
MQRILSTYRFVNQPLGAALLAEIAQAGFSAVEIFCASQHFSYREPQRVREIGDALDEYRLRLHSMHSPTDRDRSPGRESGVVISISDPQYLIQHMWHGRQSADPRKLDAAFTSLESLSMFAKARGVTIALENTPDELGAPASLQHFITDTHLHDLKLCFDIGHAHIEEGAQASFDAMRERVVSTHIHDNHGDKDEHLLPFEGTIDWDAALAGFAGAPVELPFVFEIKAQASAAGPTLAQIREAYDKLEEQFEA